MFMLRTGVAALALACSMGLANAQTANPPADDTTAAKPAMTKTEDEKPPLTGANSFTETQAKERIGKAGFQDVKALKKDDNGVWHGQAKKSGEDVNVALDYRGNVVQQ